MENFHRLLNESIEVYHPKISYAIYKYKIYLTSIYSKIKDALIKKIPVKKEKFSIIEDITNFISNYNSKYKSNLDIYNIIQGDSDEINLINKVFDYMLNIFYGYEKEDIENNLNINDNNNQKINDLNVNDDTLMTL